MQATKTNPGIPLSPATTTGRSEKQTNPTKAVQRAYNIQYFVDLDRITVHGNVHPLPCRCTNSVSVTCQLTQVKKPIQTPVLHLTYSDPVPALGFLANTMKSRSVSCPPPLSHSGSRYMHPTHHIAVKSASDTSLFESAYAHLEVC